MNRTHVLLWGSILIVVMVVAIASFSGISTYKPAPGEMATNRPAATTSLPSNNSSTARTAQSYEYDVNRPNALMLVDSQGRRTGKDPAAGTLYHEIPSTAYSEESHSGQLFVSGNPVGRYTLYVVAGKSGPYWVDAYPPEKVSGTIQANAMVAYTLNFNPASAENPALVFQATLPSTASITSAPPHNLPPPPVR